MEKAAIVAYGVPTSRPEHSIIYISDSFNDLVTLLTNPTSYFAKKDDVNSPIDWTLLEHSTIVIQPLSLLTGSEAIRNAFLLNWPGPVGLEPSFIDLSVRASGWLKDAPPGTFVAEFATETRTLTIRYRRPKSTEPDIPRFQGQIEPITHVPIENAGKAEIGNLHFDIKSDTPDIQLYRAQLAVDYLENPKRLESELNKSTVPFYEGQAVLAPILAGTTLAIGKPSQPPMRPSVTCDKEYEPTIVIEGGSMPDTQPGAVPGCSVCVDGDTRIPTGTIIVGDLVFKCYKSEAPPHH